MTEKNVVTMDEHKARTRATQTRAEFTVWDSTGALALSVYVDSANPDMVRVALINAKLDGPSAQFQMGTLGMTLERILAALEAPTSAPDDEIDDDD